MDQSIRHVYNHYNNFKSILKFAKIENIEELKKRFSISPRRMDTIRNCDDFVKYLEKSGEIHAFQVEPLKSLSEFLDTSVQCNLNNFIKIHQKLIVKCDNIEIPVYNEYAREILECRPENNSNFLVSTPRSNERVLNTNVEPRGVDRNLNTDLNERYFEIIDVISTEIGERWKDLARYMKLREHEIEDIDRSQRFLRQKARKSLQILIEREQDGVKSIIIGALAKSRRNDLVEIVTPLF